MRDSIGMHRATLAHRVALVLAAVLAALLVLAALPTPARGQALGELQPGARVRLRAPPVVAGRLTGTVIGRTGDTLVVAGEKVGQVRVPVRALSRIEVSRGKSHARGAIAGTMWGGGIGLALGVLMAAAPADSADDVSRGEYVLWSTVSGALVGLPVGAVIGRERWERFDLPVQAALAPLPRGLAVRLTLR